MQKRKPGNTGLEVSAIGLGCMGMSFGYTPFPEKKDMIELMSKAIEQGSIQLTKKELQEIEDASAHIEIMGTRYTEAMEKSTGL